MGIGVFVLGAECNRWQRSSACLFHITRNLLPFSSTWCCAAETPASSPSSRRHYRCWLFFWGGGGYVILSSVKRWSYHSVCVCVCSVQSCTQWVSVFKPQQVKWVTHRLLWGRCHCFFDHIPDIRTNTLFIMFKRMIITCKSDVRLWPDRLLGRSVTFLALFLCRFYELCCASPSAGAPVSLGCDSVIRGELWGCLDPTFLWISTQLKFYCFRGSVEAKSKRTCSTMFDVWCHRVRLRLILWEPVLFFFKKKKVNLIDIWLD